MKTLDAFEYLQRGNRAPAHATLTSALLENSEADTADENDRVSPDRGFYSKRARTHHLLFLPDGTETWVKLK